MCLTRTNLQYKSYILYILCRKNSDLDMCQDYPKSQAYIVR